MAHICVAVHKSVVETGTRYWQEVRRRLYATPSSYMELITLYARMLRDNKRKFVSNRQRLQMGLTTLSDAKEMVGEMQEELLSLGPMIVRKSKVCWRFQRGRMRRGGGWQAGVGVGGS